MQTLVHPVGDNPGSCNEYSEDCVVIAGCDMEAGVDGCNTRYGAEGDVLCGYFWDMAFVCKIVQKMNFSGFRLCRLISNFVSHSDKWR